MTVTPNIVARASTAVLLLMAVLMLVGPRPVEAATITVDTLMATTAVDGQCSLPEAVQNATTDAATNADCAAGAGSDTITFAVDGTITLTAALNVSAGGALVIDGSGRSVILSGGTTNKILTGLGSTLEVRALAFTDGFAVNGAAITMQSGSLTIIDSTFTSNVATTTGGAVRALASTATIRGSTFSGNDGGQAGGAISLEGVTSATITNTTVSGNSVGALAAQGGGIFALGGASATLTNVTIVGNTATTGGGIRSDGAVDITNTIIADNTAGTGPDCTGVMSNGNNNVTDTTDCGLVAEAGDQFDVAANLDALASNGGRGQTHALTATSPGLDAGSTAACNGLPGGALDQRGITRPQGSACDMGAYEALQLTVADLSQAEGNSGTSTFNAVVTLSQVLPADFPDVTVDYDTADGTATAGSDYTAVVGGTVTFTAGGAATQDAAVTVSGDTTAEGSETFVVDLSGASGAVIVDAQATITIAEDDAASVDEPPPPTLTAGGFTLVVTDRDSITLGLGASTTLSTSTPRGATLSLLIEGDVQPAGWSLSIGGVAGLAALTASAPPPDGFIVMDGFMVELRSDGVPVDEALVPPATATFTIDPGDTPLREITVRRWDGAAWVHVPAVATKDADGLVTIVTTVAGSGPIAVFHVPGLGAYNPPVRPTGVTVAIWGGGSIGQAAEGQRLLVTIVDGRFLFYSPGVPDFVNARFLAAFPGGEIPRRTVITVVPAS